MKKMTVPAGINGWVVAPPKNEGERMTERYTPTTEEVREEFIYGHQELDMDGNVVVSFDEAQARWDRWLAEVEREAAERALSGLVKHVSDHVEDYLSIATLDALAAIHLAEVYRQERGEQ